MEKQNILNDFVGVFLFPLVYVSFHTYYVGGYV